MMTNITSTGREKNRHVGFEFLINNVSQKFILLLWQRRAFIVDLTKKVYPLLYILYIKTHILYNI